jgi:hypothetical protein
MTGIARKLTAVSIMALAASAANAADAPTSWVYEFDLKWVVGSAEFNDGTSYYGQPFGLPRQSSSTISWGYGPGMDGSVDRYGDPAKLRSSIVIAPTNVYSSLPLSSDGKVVSANAFTHYNNAIDGSFSTLNNVKMAMEITLVSTDGGFSRTWTQVFDVYFKETPNLTGKPDVDGDIFAITWDGEYSENFTYDGYDYTFNYFEETESLKSDPRSQALCNEVGKNCAGFVTSEGKKTTVDFAFNITGTATPVPEPETYAMLLAGLGIVGAVARRRRNYISAV